MGPEVTYIILNYNPFGTEKIHQRLESSVKALYERSDPSITKEVIMFDQGSPGPIVESINKMMKDYGLRAVFNHKNIGISGALNLGFGLAKGYRIALLTYDVLITTGLDKSCLDKLSTPGTFHVVPLSDVGDNPRQVWHVPEPFGSNTVSRLPGGSEEAALVELTVNYFSREAIQKIGYFDERWMACYENMDYSLRTMLAGGKTIIDRGAFAWHYHNTSSKLVGRNHFYEGRYEGDPFADGRINKLWLDKWGPAVNSDLKLDSWRLPSQEILEKYRRSHQEKIYLGWPQSLEQGA